MAYAQFLRLDALFALLLFRGLPLVLFVVGSARYALRIRVLALAMAALAATGASTNANLLATATLAAGALAYFAGAASIAYRLIVRGYLADKLLLLITSAVLFVVAPWWVAPPLLVAPAVILGVDAMLSIYSAGAHAAHAPFAVSLREFCFFVAVDPVLAFAGRSVRDGKCSVGAGSRRILLGLGAWGAEQSLYWASGALDLRVPDALGSARALTELVLTSVVFGLALYLSHSGLASIQIGLLRSIGFSTPERYNRPYLSKSPKEFWTRWNTWLGEWAKWHLFLPIAHGIARRFRKLSRRYVHAAAAVATFGCIGLLHDAVLWLIQGGFRLRLTFPLPATLMFLVFAGFVVAWPARLPERLRAAIAWRPGRLSWTATRLLNSASLFLLACPMVWLAVSVLSRGRFPWE